MADDDFRAYFRSSAEAYREISENRNEIEKKLEIARKAIQDQTSLMKKFSDTNLRTKENEKIDKLLLDTKGFLNDFSLVKQFDELRQLTGVVAYSETIKETLEIGDKLKSLCEAGDWRGVGETFRNFSQFLSRLSSTSCSNLFRWNNQYADSWRRHCINRLSSIIEGRFEAAGLPQNPLHMDDKLAEEMRPLAQSLFDVALMKAHPESNQRPSPVSESEEHAEAIGIVTNAFLRPFAKRFVHHFCGSSDTAFEHIVPSGGSSGGAKLTEIKPEWFLSLIIKWNRQFAPWMDKLRLSAKNSEQLSFAARFTCGLVDLARKRLKSDLLRCTQMDSGCLPHLIDEAVTFDSDIRAQGYPESEPGCSDLLIEPGIFELWLQLEQAEAVKCIEAFLADPSAWTLRYGDRRPDSDVDTEKVPFITDNVLLLLTAVSYRFSFVRSNEHRRLFIRMQSTLLHEFGERLAATSRQLPSPIAKTSGQEANFAALLNTCSYVCNVLSEWQESPAYLNIGIGVFDEVIDLFNQRKKALTRDASTAVLKELEPAIVDYRKTFASCTSRGDTSLAGQAMAFLLLPLQSCMSTLNRTLNRKNYQEFVRVLATAIEEALIEKVIMELRLDQATGEELQKQLGDVMLKSAFENYGLMTATAYFTRLKQYLIIAGMNPGNCTLLREALKERRQAAERTLTEMGLEALSLDEVQALLQRRSDLL